jgi:formylglycine-generating enzyme required for sulfatase activity
MIASRNNSLKYLVRYATMKRAIRLLLFSLLLCSPGSAEQATIPEMQFVRILPGEFMMGCSAGDAECLDDEKPAHRVRITRSFEVENEVTQAEWLAVMRNNPSEFSGPNRPVEHVVSST